MSKAVQHKRVLYIRTLESSSSFVWLLGQHDVQVVLRHHGVPVHSASELYNKHRERLDKTGTGRYCPTTTRPFC